MLNWMLMGCSAVEKLVLMDVPLCLVLGVLVCGLWCPCLGRRLTGCGCGGVFGDCDCAAVGCVLR